MLENSVVMNDNNTQLVIIETQQINVRALTTFRSIFFITYQGTCEVSNRGATLKVGGEGVSLVTQSGGRGGLENTFYQ